MWSVVDQSVVTRRMTVVRRGRVTPGANKCTVVKRYVSVEHRTPLPTRRSRNVASCALHEVIGSPLFMPLLYILDYRHLVTFSCG